MNQAPARPLRSASVEPPRKRLDTLLLWAALLVPATPLRHGLARLTVNLIEFLHPLQQNFSTEILV